MKKHLNMACLVFWWVVQLYFGVEWKKRHMFQDQAVFVQNAGLGARPEMESTKKPLKTYRFNWAR